MSNVAGCERIATPVGADLEIISGAYGIEAVRFILGDSSLPENPNFLTAAAASQLREYFAGERTDFDLPLAPFFADGPGTPYRRRIWRALCEIPLGETRTYGELATRVGGSARSVGNANGANRLCVLIPCHRVIGKDGFGGYGGPDVTKTDRESLLAIKQNLLAHEAEVRGTVSRMAAG